MSTPTRSSSADRDARTHPDAARAGNRRRRVASAAVGGTLLTLGVRRRSLAGTAMALAGGWLLYRGVRGRSRPSQSLGGDAESERERPGTGWAAGATVVERSVTVGKPADELHQSLRDPEVLMQVVGDAASVTSRGEDRHHWTVTGPLGRSVEWDVELVEDRPGELVRWESVEGATLSTEWSVRLRPAPGDRGTEVALTLRVDPPGGALGDAAMGVLGVVPETLASKALYRFKSLVETGEMPTLARNPSGRGRGDLV